MRQCNGSSMLRYFPISLKLYTIFDQIFNLFHFQTSSNYPESILFVFNILSLLWCFPLLVNDRFEYVHGCFHTHSGFYFVFIRTYLLCQPNGKKERKKNQSCYSPHTSNIVDIHQRRKAS